MKEKKELLKKQIIEIIDKCNDEVELEYLETVINYNYLKAVEMRRRNLQIENEEN